MPEARRREVDALLKGLTPKHERQLSVSTSNALERFSVIEAVLQDRKLVLLLDYDGTLTPIVNDPSKAVLSDRVRAILRELPKHYITGVISGRSLHKIRTFVDVPGLFYAGSHGFDILAPGQKRGGVNTLPRAPPCCPPASSFSTPPPSSSKASDDGKPTTEKNDKLTAAVSEGVVPEDEAQAVLAVPNGDCESLRKAGLAEGGSGGALEEVRHQVAEEYLHVMEKIRDELKEETKDIKGSEVEDNRFSVSMHYRNCAREDVPRIKEIVMKVQANHAQIRMGSGKEVFELQPDIAWDKGKAVLWLLDELVVPSALPSSAAEAATATTAAVSEDSRSAGVTKVNIVGDAGEGHGRSATASTGHAAGNGEDEDDDSNHGGDDEGAWNFFTIFIGDDKTDENAFRALNGDAGGKRHDGIGILVSEESRETSAAYTLRNPHEVALFLEKIVELGNERSLGTYR